MHGWQERGKRGSKTSLGPVIQMKMEILLIRTCALVHALIGTAATRCVDNDRGADYVRISREVRP